MDIGCRPLIDTDFFILWISIEKELQKLVTGSRCCASKIYNDIYAICTSSAKKFEAKLYWKIGDFVYAFARGIRKEVFDSPELISAYNKGFRRFKEVVFAINELCDFLNECIGGRTMQDFCFLLWERCVLQQIDKCKHTTFGTELVNADRVDDVVKEAIESFRFIIPDSRQPLLYYEQKYEHMAIQKILTKYENEICLVDVNVEAYSSYMKERMLHENNSMKRLFLQESWQKIEMILENIFIRDHYDYIYTGIYEAMSAHRLPIETLEYGHKCFMYKDRPSFSGIEKKGFRLESSEAVCPINSFYELQEFHVPHTLEKSCGFSDDVMKKTCILYKNLSWIKSGCEILKSAFEKYVDSECKRYAEVYGKSIESIYFFYCMLRHIINIGFAGDSNFFSILDRCFSKACTRLKPSIETRLIEFSTFISVGDKNMFVFFEDESVLSDEFCDVKHFTRFKAPHGKNFHLPPRVKDDDKFCRRDLFLQKIFLVLYKLVERKQDLYEIYLAALGKRLLEHSSEVHLEKRLIELMRERGNSDFVRKAEAIISDVDMSLRCNKDKDRFVWILTQVYWPFIVEELSIRVPTPLDKIKKMYDSKLSKKKIFWAWSFGKVTVEIAGHEISMNIPQYIVVDMFNMHRRIDLDFALKEAGIGTRVTRNAFKSLVDCALLVKSGDSYEISKEIRNVKPDITSFYVEEGKKAVCEVDKEVYYQSTVSSIMKKGKKIKIPNIIEEITLIHTERFDYDGASLSESIKILIEKGIIEEVEDFYIYLP